MSVTTAIGIMSGTSLDGVDLAYCVFDKKEGQWEFDIIKAITVEYDDEWKNKLISAPKLCSKELIKLDYEYGHYLGRLVSAFAKRQNLKPDIVASHGHTIFHNPKEKYTLQIGNGTALRSHISCPLVFDFRSQDIALGGQGAPLVPIGDELLFHKYDACINLGGFANISLDKDGERIAWDIGPFNLVFNYLAKKKGFEYDKNGDIAMRGNINNELLDKLNSIDYYSQPHPKSLGREWFEEVFTPIIENSYLSTENKMRTCAEHISLQIANSFSEDFNNVLFTGGGAFNRYLMKLIEEKTNCKITVPNELLINYKEALIFAFLGVLRINNEVNVLSSVTGAVRNHSSGSLIN